MDHTSRASSPAKTQHRPRASRRRQNWRNTSLVLLATLANTTWAQTPGQCVPLRGSVACPAFQSASVSTSQNMVQFFAFLDFVSDTASFDDQLLNYARTSFVRDKYQYLFGCHGINFTNSSDLYARFSTTVLCNALVQMSMSACGVSLQNAPPLCAETCAEFAQSEAYITADKELCSDPNADLTKLIRADFTNCALPEESLSGACINGIDNEPDNCGFGNSTIGLCSYCGAGGINSTDTCCYHSNAEKRCHGVKLPAITATLNLTVPSATATATATGSAPARTKPPPTAATAVAGTRLSPGAIAGIVVGSFAGLVILAALLFFCISKIRQKRGSQQGSIFNQPTPTRKGPPVIQAHHAVPTGYEVLPGGRVARMSALEGHSGNSPSARQRSLETPELELTAHTKHMSNASSSSDFGRGSPSPELQFHSLRAPPAASRRQASLGGNSMLSSEHTPEKSGDGTAFPSPHGVASNQSEQLPFFKDYYSQDDIHPGDKVAVLWAYQPRAVDEFSLERGNMLKVVGIWDDGWATGLLIDQRAEDWDPRRHGKTESDQRPRAASPVGNHRDLKAFPLVCVCLPDHWRRTIEGDASTASAGSALGRSVLMS